MWMKSVPYCTYSTFKDKRGAPCRDIKAIKDEFSEIPNYRLTSKAFDAQHLDRFITKFNSQDSINFGSANFSAAEIQSASKDKLNIL